MPRTNAAGPVPLLLLTGSPGCGKTTVAPLVADRHPRSISLDLDWFFAKLRSGAISPWLVEADAQNRAVLHAAAEACATLAAEGYVTVAEGILSPTMVDLFAAACRRDGVTLHYAVLHCPLALVLQRVQDRTSDPAHAGALADAAVVTDLWAAFESLGVQERHRVDVSGRSPLEVAEEIDRRLRDGTLRLDLEPVQPERGAEREVPEA
jgi:broad-specificity NMP kinase